VWLWKEIQEVLHDWRKLMKEPQRDARQVQIVEELKNGTPKNEIADKLQISRVTLWRDLRDLQEKALLVIAPSDLTEIKAAQLKVFELIERNLIEGTIPTDVAREWRGIRSEISQLLGLNAPSKHISAHVSAPDDANYMRFRAAVSGLTEDQLYEVYRFAKSLSREKLPMTDAQFMEVLNKHQPQPLALPEGEKQ
jgi:DNA-binding Lrp family transcriptional regulator